jgi:hypothetical protein
MKRQLLLLLGIASTLLVALVVTEQSSTPDPWALLEGPEINLREAFAEPKRGPASTVDNELVTSSIKAKVQISPRIRRP